MRDLDMGGGDESARLGLHGPGEFMGEELLIPAQQDCIHLSPRVNVNCHGSCCCSSSAVSGMYRRRPDQLMLVWSAGSLLSSMERS